MSGRELSLVCSGVENWWLGFRALVCKAEMQGCDALHED
jgi:hypothetical protein